EAEQSQGQGWAAAGVNWAGQPAQAQCEGALGCPAAGTEGFSLAQTGTGSAGAGEHRDLSLVCCLCKWFSCRGDSCAPENYPLYIRSVPTENELKFHYTVHTSLDVVDEKISAMGKALVDQRELYLGLLYPTEDYKVYGYVTNSKVKFVMVVDSSNTALRDNEIRSMFRKLHNSYTDIMCNPFYNPGDRIHSRAFDTMVNSMMMQVC
uniref:Trafficking protein particle complex subunit 2-like protein n=1 Tax=Geospiza parvula TaxID=87175 RepID=A0A8C3N2D5_GEOPR